MILVDGFFKKVLIKEILCVSLDCTCKRRTCELLHPVSFAFSGLAPQYTVFIAPT
jgi:hypothetical protein